MVSISLGGSCPGSLNSVNTCEVTVCLAPGGRKILRYVPVLIELIASRDIRHTQGRNAMLRAEVISTRTGMPGERGGSLQGHPSSEGGGFCPWLHFTVCFEVAPLSGDVNVANLSFWEKVSFCV